MTERKDGRFQEKVYINGELKYFYGKTRKEITKKIRAYKGKLNDLFLFENVADEWWESIDDKLEYNTRKGYKAAFERAKEAFKGQMIGDILPVQITRELKILARKFATKTVKNQLLVYRLIFRYAVEMGYILQNPARDISTPEGRKTESVGAPSDDDITAIKANRDSDPFGMFAYFAMYTGLRRGELLALKWEDVDMEKRLITVNKSVYFDANIPRVKAPKTKKSVGVVPILDALYNSLTPKEKGYVFPNAKGEMMTKSQFEKAWREYRERTGVTCSVHQLRHMFATMLFENDVKPEKAQHLLRHAQLSTTMDVYTHLRTKKRNEIFEDVYSIDVI